MSLPGAELPPERETLLAQAHADLDWIAANGASADLEYLAPLIHAQRLNVILAAHIAATGTWPDPAPEHATAQSPEPATGP